MRAGWRPMQAGDLDRVAEIAAIGFPDHFEGRDCFANRLDLYPAGCLVLQGDERIDGYLVAYPWRADAAPALNTLIGAIPEDAGLLYLHDLALDPEVRGQGWSRPAIGAVLALARRTGRTCVALVAVNDAAAFWQGHGFEVRDAAAMAAKLASYGPQARYMTRPV
jgi:ribosomal protein S18 acetylase RimI-like enzyme